MLIVGIAGLVVVAVGAGVAVARASGGGGAGGGGGGAYGRGGDEAQIRATVQRFAWAVDRSDRERVVGLLCAEEAEPFLDDEPAPSGRAADGPAEDVAVADVRVTGDTASARVDRPDRSPATLHLRREEGRWTICAPAGDQAGPSR